MNTPAALTPDMLRYLKFRWNTGKTTHVLSAICALASFPLISIGVVILTYISGSHNNPLNSLATICIAVGSLALEGSALITFISALIHYDWLHNRNLSDVRLSLPIKRGTMFWGDFIYGIVPIVVMNLITGACSIFFYGLFRAKDVTDITYTVVGNEYPVGFLFAFLFTLLLSAVALYATTVFVSTLCGKVLSAAGFSILLQILLPCFVLTICAIWFGKTPEIPYWETVVAYLVSSVSVLGILFVSLISFTTGTNFLFGAGADGIPYIPIQVPGIAIAFVLVTALFAYAAYRISLKRAAENTGKDFAFKIVYPVFFAVLMFEIIAGVFITVLRSSMSNGITDSTVGVLIGMIIATVFLFLVCTITKNRGFKHFGKELISYLVILAVSCGIGFGLPEARAFGAGDYVPDAEDVKSIKIDNLPFRGGSLMYNPIMPYNDAAIFTEPENIEVFIRNAKISIENGSFERSGNYLKQTSGRIGSYQSVVYTLKNGREVRRNLAFDSAECIDLMHLAFSKEYNENYFNRFEANVLNSNYNGYHFQWASIKSLKMTENEWQQNNVGVTDEAAIMKIYEAVKADRMAETYEEYFDAAGRKAAAVLELKGRIIKRGAPDGAGYPPESMYETGGTLIIPDTYTRTIKACEEVGLTLNSPEQGKYGGYGSEYDVSVIDDIGADNERERTLFLSLAVENGTISEEEFRQVLSEAVMTNGKDYGRYSFNLTYVQLQIPEKYNDVVSKWFDNSQDAVSNHNGYFGEDYAVYDDASTVKAAVTEYNSYVVDDAYPDETVFEE
ncbi:MAG: hypothetical protein LBN40_06270 [Oscillospiraceae bacterium]|jgi:hypothetical protein|nr:hypothetical protein [Oscillospiraceae bacterium]